MDQENNQNMNNHPNMASGGSENGGVGALIGSVIVILILVVGGFYFWGKEVSKRDSSGDGTLQTETANGDITDLESELDTIDLNVGDEFNATLDTEI